MDVLCCARGFCKGYSCVFAKSKREIVNPGDPFCHAKSIFPRLILYNGIELVVVDDVPLDHEIG